MLIIPRKASIGMYSGCDTLSLQTLFVYFLALPSLLHPVYFVTGIPSITSISTIFLKFTKINYSHAQSRLHNVHAGYVLYRALFVSCHKGRLY